MVSQIGLKYEETRVISQLKLLILIALNKRTFKIKEIQITINMTF